MRGCCCIVGVLLSTWSAVPVAAQTPSPDLPRHRVWIEAGVGWQGSEDLGGMDAALRENDPTPSPYRVFDVDARLASAPSFETAVGFSVTRRLVVEARLSYSHPLIEASLDSDIEGAADATATDRLDQYVVDGGISYALSGMRVASWIPFVMGGAGYVRQLHEGQVVIDHGRVYYAGAGVRRLFAARDRGVVRGWGVRADARLNLFDGGASFDDGVRPAGAASARVFVVF